CFAVKLHSMIESIPYPVMGGIFMLLFGFLAVSGIRMLLGAKVDYAKCQTLILTCIVCVIDIRVATLQIGEVDLSGMRLATVVAIILGIFFKLIDVLNLSNED